MPTIKSGDVTPPLCSSGNELEYRMVQQMQERLAHLQKELLQLYHRRNRFQTLIAHEKQEGSSFSSRENHHHHTEQASSPQEQQQEPPPLHHVAPLSVAHQRVLERIEQHLTRLEVDHGVFIRPSIPLSKAIPSVGHASAKADHDHDPRLNDDAEDNSTMGRKHEVDDEEKEKSGLTGAAERRREIYERIVFPFTTAMTTPAETSYHRLGGPHNNANPALPHSSLLSSPYHSNSTQYSVPLAYHPFYVSGALKMPDPFDLDYSKAVWGEQLGALEQLQRQHGDIVCGLPQRMERLAQRCEAFFDAWSAGLSSSSLVTSSSPSSKEAEDVDPLSSLPQNLQRWLSFNPQYTFPKDSPFNGGEGARASLDKERAIWQRVASMTGNPLEEVEVSVAEGHEGAINHNSTQQANTSSSSNTAATSASRRIRPRDFNDLYALCLDNQRRYAVVQERWREIKRLYTRLVQYANELLCDATLKLDRLEEEKREKHEKETRS